MDRWIKALILCCVLVCAALPATAWASPFTGDQGITKWIVLMVVSVIILIGVVVLMLKRNKRDR